MSAIIELSSVGTEEELKKIEEVFKKNRTWKVTGRASNYISVSSLKKEYGEKSTDELATDLSEYLAEALKIKPEDAKPRVKLSYIYLPHAPDIVLSNFARK
jgi:hypothetical protein